MRNTIDTLSIFDELKKVFSEEKAHTLSEIFKNIHEENLDIVATKRDLKEMGTLLKRDLKEMSILLKRDLKEMAILLKKDLKIELKDLEMRLTIRLGVMLATSIAIVAALIKLL